jgi:hypothetical protein
MDNADIAYICLSVWAFIFFILLTFVAYKSPLWNRIKNRNIVIPTEEEIPSAICISTEYYPEKPQVINVVILQYVEPVIITDIA